ncbi:MAG: multiprotein bridging factor aMBF1 [Candidatus Nanoarchaeia archaeon]|nr:multiprotein bridging factor aMBF1 [Candidatus Nanoarchaeia archaeon]
MVNCELCGRSAQLIEAVVEGTMLSLCQGCSKFGNVVSIPKSPIRTKVTQKVVEIDKYLDEIVPDYADKVKTARESLKLDQQTLALKINEKLSTLQRIESGKLTPTITTARKLEKELRIRIVDKYNLPQSNKLNLQNEKLTIGDIIKLEKDD